MDAYAPQPPEDSRTGTGSSTSAQTAMPVEDLVENAIDTTVRTAEESAGQALVAELELRGEDAVWQAALLLLGVLATRPVYGLQEHAGVERLRHVARGTPDQVTALVLEVMAIHRESGAMGAAGVWRQAPGGIRGLALVQLLIAVCSSVGSESGRLTAAQSVALIRRAIRPSPAGVVHNVAAALDQRGRGSAHG